MALRAGFFNAIRDASTGEYDRKYNADDYSNFLSAFIRDGVRRGAMNRPADGVNILESDLKVTIAGRSVSISAGKAMVLGKWVENTTTFTFGEEYVLPASGQTRIDRICLRVEKLIDREPSFVWKKGASSATSPVAPELINNENTKEICLAELVFSSTDILSIKDTRGDENLCGWITTPVGYDDYFAALDEAFNVWFQEKKDTLASTTLFKEYIDRVVVNATTNVVTFNIPQYEGGSTDIIHIYTNGILEVEGVDYTLNDRTITFTGTKIAGTEIVVIVYKSIDGTGLGTISDQLTNLENRVEAIEGAGSISEYNYFCNGVDDNVKISTICDNFTRSPNYQQMRLNVYGKVGIRGTVGGDGSISRPYLYFGLGTIGAVTKGKIIVNFANAERITIDPIGTYATIFAGNEVSIENVQINVASGQNITFFEGEKIDARDCEFYANTTYDVIGLKGSGYFSNCKFSIASQLGNAFCFYGNGGLQRVFGGNYYAWTAASTKESVCFYVEGSQTENVLVANGVNCPQYLRDGMFQTNTIKINSGYASLTGCTTFKEPAIYPAGLTDGKVTKNGVMVISKAVQSA